MTLAAPASAAWRVAETENFRVYSEGSEKTLTMRAERLERFDLLLRRLTRVPDDRTMPPLTVYMTNNPAHLADATGVGRSIAGFYIANADGIAAFVSRSARGGPTGDDILLHEYVHHFMMQHFPLAYPRWYVEGFAEYFQTADLDGDFIAYGVPSKMRTRALASFPWVPMDLVLKDEVGPLGDLGATMFYAQSWLLTHYLQRTEAHAGKLPDYMEQVANGAAPVAAFEETFGIEVDTLERVLRAYARKGMSYSRIDVPDGFFETRIRTIERLPGSIDGLVIRHAALMAGVTGRKSETILAKLRRDAADAPDDEALQRLWMSAEAVRGDAQAAIAPLAARLEADPADADAAFLTARAQERLWRETGDKDMRTAARGSYAQAFRHRPDHFETLFGYARLSTDAASANTRDALLEAHRLAPQVVPIGAYLSLSYAGAGEFDEAIAILKRVRGRHLSDNERTLITGLLQAIDQSREGGPATVDLPAMLSEQDGTETEALPEG